MELRPGEMLGPYRLVERAGAGGMAEVWRGFQASVERFVAVKVLPRHFAQQPGYLQRFRREVLAVSRLEHPNILTVHDAGEQDGYTYMVTPFVSGGTLAQRLGQRWSVEQAVRTLAPLASALDYAHSQGVIHRDVKPSNVLLTESGRVVLGDFGVALVSEGAIGLTQTGTLIGTPAYMAPEQVLGEPAGPASDLYSLGIIAFEMLAGQPPFQAETPIAVAMAQVHRPLPPARTINPDLSQAVEAVLFKTLAKSPAERYPSVSAMVAALASAGGVAGTTTELLGSASGAGGEHKTLLELSARGGGLRQLMRQRGALLLGAVALGGVGLLALTWGKSGPPGPTPTPLPTVTSVRPTTTPAPLVIVPTAIPATATTRPFATTRALAAVVTPVRTVVPTVPATATPALFAIPGWNYADELTDFHVPPQNTLQTNVGSPTPLELPGAGVVVTADLLRGLQSGRPFLLIDALDEATHPTIAGALRMPEAGAAGTFTDDVQFELGRSLRTETGGSPNVPIVVFCEGARCWESYNAGLRLVALGYTNVYWYRGGLDSWEEAGLPLVP